jgi:hypothetical protein
MMQVLTPKGLNAAQESHLHQAAGGQPRKGQGITSLSPTPKL